MRRCVYPRRGRGLTEGVTACAVGARAHLRSAYRWMADDVDAQSDDDGGRCGNPMGDGGRWGEATAEGRFYNRSPRLACLPGVGC